MGALKRHENEMIAIQVNNYAATVCCQFRCREMENPFFDRDPARPSPTSLPLGWYLLPFQGNESMVSPCPNEYGR